MIIDIKKRNFDMMEKVIGHFTRLHSHASDRCSSKLSRKKDTLLICLCVSLFLMHITWRVYVLTDKLLWHSHIYPVSKCDAEMRVCVLLTLPSLGNRMIRKSVVRGFFFLSSKRDPRIGVCMSWLLYANWCRRGASGLR